jgi:WD40 repeat protein
MDAKLAITDPSRWSVVRTLEGHKRGVYTFAHCHYYRCLLSAGFDRKVYVWDPYINTPTGSLNDEHHGEIIDVVVNESKNQVTQICPVYHCLHTTHAHTFFVFRVGYHDVQRQEN